MPISAFWFVISDVILNKPGKLTPEEFKIIKSHTTLGSEIVKEVFGGRLDDGTISVINDIVLCHHEKWDGSGYPQGLKGDDIPLAARIMAVADVFDALVSNRSYKDSFSTDRAYEILIKDSGTHFDKRIVDAFISIRPKVDKSILYDKDSSQPLSMTFEEFINTTKPYIHPEDREMYVSTVERDTIRDLFKTANVRFITFRNLHLSENAYYEMKLIKLGTSGDKNFDVLVGLHDISESELKKIKEKNELAKAKKRAETANAAKIEFVYRISHDIRIPLNDIVGFTEMAIKYISNTEDSLAYMEKAKRSEESLISVINRILDIESINSNLESPNEETVNSIIESNEKIDTEKALNGKRILLVEDNELNREIAQSLLDECGAEVETAEDGSVAVNKLTSLPADYFDVVLMDIQMPVMDGIEASMRIRALDDKKLSQIPIVAMTANAFEKDKQTAAEAGMNAHLSKPVDIQETISVINKLTEKVNR